MALSQQELKNIHDTLFRHITYYKKMNNKGKGKFIERLLEFIDSKEFIGRNGLEITDEIKAVIGASAIQLTFGLEEYTLSNYNTIYVYPESFYSEIVGKKMKGGTSPKEAMAFSWKDMKEGYAIPDDRYNLGLHEMAHALKLEVIHGDTFDRAFAAYLENWLNISREEFMRMREGHHSFLREYGSVNEHEFFAVCVEHFFEAPAAFKERLPQIYHHLCILLNQDPTNALNNYDLKQGKKIRRILERQIQKRPLPKAKKEAGNFHWTMGVFVLGLLSGFIGLPILLFHTMIPLMAVFSILITGFILGYFIHYKLLIKSGYMDKGIMNFYLIFGFLPFLFFLLLLLNYLIPFKTSVETYAIERAISHPSEVEFVLKNDKHPQYDLHRTFSDEEIRLYPNKNPSGLRVEINTGMMGWETVKNKELIYID